MQKPNKVTESGNFIGLIGTAWMNELLVCKNAKGKSFIARLRAIRGDSLLFENKDGVLIWDSIDDIKSASLLRPPKPCEVVSNAGVV